MKNSIEEVPQNLKLYCDDTIGFQMEILHNERGGPT